MVNKEYAHILLDLDGTIIDSGVGVTKSVQYALACCGIKETDRARLNRFVGPPLKDSFMDFYGLTEEQAEVAIENTGRDMSQKESMKIGFITGFLKY